MATYRFHHMSLLAANRDLMRACEHFYVDTFGMHVAVAAGDTPETSFSFLADDAPSGIAPLEIIGDIFEERETTFMERHGPGIDHICFLVDDLEASFRSLQKQGVQFHVQPYDFIGSRIAWCKDPAGVEVELLEREIPRDLQRPLPETIGAIGQFNHVGILTGSRELAEKTESFYRDRFRMRVIHRGDPSRPEMDWVYLEDGTGENPFWLEVVGPALWDEEQEFLKKHGPGMDHVCFVVKDLDAAYRRVKGRGVKIHTEPLDYNGSRMFYVRDPVGAMVQVVEPRWARTSGRSP